jgi:hypothetical protein
VRRKKNKELKMENLVDSWKNSKQANKRQTKKNPSLRISCRQQPKNTNSQKTTCQIGMLPSVWCGR